MSYTSTESELDVSVDRKGHCKGEKHRSQIETAFEVEGIDQHRGCGRYVKSRNGEQRELVGNHMTRSLQ